MLLGVLDQGRVLQGTKTVDKEQKEASVNPANCVSAANCKEVLKQQTHAVGSTHTVGRTLLLMYSRRRPMHHQAKQQPATRLLEVNSILPKQITAIWMIQVRPENGLCECIGTQWVEFMSETQWVPAWACWLVLLAPQVWEPPTPFPGAC